jgi:hypothetical protein
MRVLLVTSRFPLPQWRGNQVRTVEWLEALRGHDLGLVCPEPPDRTSGELPADVSHYSLGAVSRCTGLLQAAVSGLPLQEGLYNSGTARRALSTMLRSWQPDVVVVQMVRCAWAAATVWKVSPSLPVVFDSIDAMGLHFERAAEVAAPALAVAYRTEAKRCRRRERMLVTRARFNVAVSERDLAALGAPEGRGRVIPVAGRLTVGSGLSRTEPVVLLSGNLGYRPTAQGAEWFAREVWPLLHQRVPEARWILAGARPARAVQRLAELAGVEVHADVPDLGPFLRSARVAIAPMSSGSGVPMKVLEALAAGVPAVANPWAAEGLSGEVGEAVAAPANAAEWVEELERLLTDSEAARDLSERGHALWQRVYRPERVAEQIRQVVAEAADSRR